MKVKLLNRTRVYLSAGSIVNVDEQEAKRLLAYRLAEPVAEKAKKEVKK